MARKKENNYFSSYYWSNPEISEKILNNIKDLSGKIIKKTGKKPGIMEVCGTHTMAIAYSGIRSMIGDYVDLTSGPGCPVCVTSGGDIDRILEFARFKNVIITSFGDMLKVKGSKGFDLNHMRVKGSDVRIVYSPMDAVEIARKNPDKDVVFIGVGFETTAPTIAGAVKMAAQYNLNNFYVTPLFKLVPPALRFLLDSKYVNIDGFILPGHVSVIIGWQAYEFLDKEYKIPSVISGFEPLDILRSVELLLDKIYASDSSVNVEYTRAVTKEGNVVARKLLEEVFNVSDAYWRAVGVIKKSGYSFARKYDRFDAFKKFKIKYAEAKEPAGCLCGKILLGIAKPTQCPHFGTKCTPENAVGPCMVSSEGACAAWYKYGVEK